MKYKILISITVTAIAAMLFDFNNEAHGNRNGAPAGATGSPGDGAANTCARSGCHHDFALASATGWITSTIPGTGYVPGQAYTVTATATAAGDTTFGFEISPQDASGYLIGSMAAGTGTQVIGGGKYITHLNTGVFSLASIGYHTWTFTWTAPVSGTGAFSFYGAFNCANGNHHDTGDHIYTSTLLVTEAPTSGNDCGIFATVTPNGIACSGTITPVVTLGNYGTTTLTSCVINYQVDATAPSTFTWSGSLATGTKLNITLPSVTTTSGAHTFTASTSAPNGGTDTLTTNDSKTSNFTVFLNGAAMPFTEGFESTTFPPSNWQRKNPDASNTWARNTSAHFAGVASAKMDNYTYATGAGQRDELISPPVDLTSQSTPSLAFEVAYRYYDATFLDTLTVYVSTDCGTTWNQIYYKSGTMLATAGASSAAFTPTLSSQWRLETISLTPYSTCSTAIFRFVAGSNDGNNLYLDNINISGVAGINEFTTCKPQLNLFPNPVNDLLSLEYSLSKNSFVSVKIFDIQGREIAELISDKNKAAGKYKLTMDTKQFNAGVYFISVTDETGVTTQKLIVSH